MEGQSKESRNLEAHRKGGQGPPRAVAPSERERENRADKIDCFCAVIIQQSNQLYSEMDNILGFKLSPCSECCMLSSG
jgi:hypothetical protein